MLNKRIIIILLHFFIANYVGAQSFSYGTQDFAFQDTFYTQQTVSGRIFYPSIGNSALAPGKFPAIAFGHGFVMDYLAYQNLQISLAKHGYIVCTANVQNGFSPNHADFAKQLLACVRWLQVQNTIDTSMFYQALDTTSAIFGHSMGGGSAMLTHAFWNGITAVAGLAPAKTNSTPSAIEALAQSNKPVLIISGKKDKVTPEPEHAQAMYEAALGQKLWVSINDAGHCNYTDANDLTCSLGATSVGEQPGLTNIQQQEMVLRYLVPFFNYYLKQDTCKNEFMAGDSLQSDTNISFQSNLTNKTCEMVNQNRLKNIDINIYPNPTCERLTIDLPKGDKFSIEILDILGKPFFKEQVENQTTISTLNWPDGVYVVKYMQQNHDNSSAFFKQIKVVVHKRG